LKQPDQEVWAAMQYGVLFRIECLHDYYGGGPCRSLTVTPTDDCRRLMARYQMLFRGSPGGGVVYCPQQSPPDLLKQFDENAAFTFTLINIDPAFGNYTDTSLGKLALSESVFHFDNRKDYPESQAGSSRQLLHQPGNAFAQAAVQVRSRISQVAPGGAAGSNEFRILEPLGNAVVCRGTLPPQGAPAPLDMRRFPEGLYGLQVDDRPPQFFYLTDELAVRRWGVISVYAGGIRQASQLPEQCRVIDNDGVVHPKTFILALESRKTIWRYYVIPSRDDQRFDEYQVVSTSKKLAEGSSLSDNDLTFDRLDGTTPLGGRDAWVFESKKAIPFLFSPAAAFALTLRPYKNGKSGQRTIRLPYAQPTSLTKNGAHPGQMCSEIFVYL
jgi:hypothetical protein